MEAQDKWLSARKLAKLIEAAKVRAVIQMELSDELTVELSRQLHDAVLACIVFGYLPPLRLSCIRSLRHFLYKGACIEPCCSIPGCRGNRVCLVSKQPLRMALALPHHKNEKAWGHVGIDLVLPDELAQLLYKFLTQPHQKLRDYHNFAEANCPFVFMSKTGKGFDNATFSTYWTNWLLANGGNRMPPSFCRQVFVAERRDDARVVGPSDQGAALIMGNSVAQWDKWYDMQFEGRLGQNAVDAMASWRQALLNGPDAEPDVQAMSVNGSDTESDYASCASDIVDDDDVIEIDID